MESNITKWTNLFTDTVQLLSPTIDSVQRDIDDIKAKYNYAKMKDTGLVNEAYLEKLAHKYANSIVTKYTSVGVASALPGAIPGIGTKVQIGIEVGAITADLALMLRWMGSMCIGIGLIYDRDVESEFSQDFIKVLGIWCGVLQTAKQAGIRVGTKVAVAQFKRFPGRVFQKINQRVGTTILAKYGTKRGGVAVGRLVPFGAGALIGGGFNFSIMKTFKASAINFYQGEQEDDLYVDSDYVVVEE